MTSSRHIEVEIVELRDLIFGLWLQFFVKTVR